MFLRRERHELQRTRILYSVPNIFRMGNNISSGASNTSGRRYFYLSVLLVGLALAVRSIGYDFDQNHHFHPDERAIADAAGRLSLDPGNLQLNPKWFNYGSFPIYIDKIVASVLSNIPGLRSYDASIWSGRCVSAVAGALTVLLLVLADSPERLIRCPAERTLAARAEVATAG
jgi:hypothetical protein